MSAIESVPSLEANQSSPPRLPNGLHCFTDAVISCDSEEGARWTAPGLVVPGLDEGSEDTQSSRSKESSISTFHIDTWA